MRFLLVTIGETMCLVSSLVAWEPQAYTFLSFSSLHHHNIAYTHSCNLGQRKGVSLSHLYLQLILSHGQKLLLSSCGVNYLQRIAFEDAAFSYHSVLIKWRDHHGLLSRLHTNTHFYVAIQKFISQLKTYHFVKISKID